MIPKPTSQHSGFKFFGLEWPMIILKHQQQEQTSSGDVDSSNHSTYSPTDDDLMKKKKKKERTNEKKVQFSDFVQLSLYYYLPEEKNQDNCDFWYSSDDLKRFRQDREIQMDQIKQQKPEIQRILKATFLLLTTKKKEKEENVVVLTIQQQKSIGRALNKDRIGLVEDFGFISRDEQRQKLFQTCCCQRQQDPERLARICQSLSKPYRLYAQQIALIHSQNLSN